MSPVIVFVTRLLPNGCTLNASPYVMSVRLAATGDPGEYRPDS